MKRFKFSKLCGESGVSIIEVLTALVVVGIGLTAATDLMMRDMKALGEDEIRCRAILIGRSLCTQLARESTLPETETPKAVDPEAGLGLCQQFTWEVTENSDVNGVDGFLHIMHPKIAPLKFPLHLRKDFCQQVASL